MGRIYFFVREGAAATEPNIPLEWRGEQGPRLSPLISRLRRPNSWLQQTGLRAAAQPRALLDTCITISYTLGNPSKGASRWQSRSHLSLVRTTS